MFSLQRTVIYILVNIDEQYIYLYKPNYLTFPSAKTRVYCNLATSRKIFQMRNFVFKTKGVFFYKYLKYKIFKFTMKGRIYLRKFGRERFLEQIVSSYIL